MCRIAYEKLIKRKISQIKVKSNIAQNHSSDH